MSGKKAKRIRRMMDHLRDNPPSEGVAKLVEAEMDYIEAHAKPISRGMCRIWKGQQFNPTRRLKKLATRIVNQTMLNRARA